MKFLTDEALRQIDWREFREKTGITKTDYRLLRNWMLGGINPELITIWKPGDNDDKPLTLHQFCQELRGIDVIYVTRLQRERQTE